MTVIVGGQEMWRTEPWNTLHINLPEELKKEF
jgi:hypothetical protein